MMQDRKMHKQVRMDPATMEPQNDGETTTLSAERYPELADAQVGQKISGRWEGTVQANDDGQVKIQYDSLELETENRADKAIKEMKNMGKMQMAPDDGEEDY